MIGIDLLYLSKVAVFPELMAYNSWFPTIFNFTSYEKDTLGIEKVATIQMSFMKNRMEVRNLMVVAPEARPDIYKNIDQNFADIEKVLGEYKSVISDDKDRENYESLVSSVSEFKKHM